jgi:DNA repair exonuclease SbcCD nuclease subunit
MNKFIFTTDWHIVFKQPGSRTDDIVNTQFDKIECFVDLCNQEKPDFIIHGGDLFDSPRNSDPTVLNKVIKILRKLKAPMYYIPGSHDLYGYNLNSYKQSYIGTLAASNCIYILNEKGIYQFAKDLHVGILPCQLTNRLEDYIMFKDCDIIVSHNMITDTSVPYDHILISDLSKAFNRKIFLCGHNHKPFYIMENNNLFVNTGPLIRTSITEKDIKPHIAVFTRDNILDITYSEKYIPVEENVFKVSEETQNNVQITFNDVLRNTDLVFNDIYQLLDHIAKEVNIDEKYVKLLKERLENAERSI